jgi:multicomponent Na+:H+ antiporter subunit E
MYVILTLLVWFAFWLLWSGLYKPLLIILGILSCLLVLVLARRMAYFDKSVYSPALVARLLPFWGWLGKELVITNFQVARIVLSPKMKISPTVVEIKALSEGPIGQAILGNSITLTPGTVTMDDHEGTLIVHCLTRKGAEDLKAGEMNRRVAALGKD